MTNKALQTVDQDGVVMEDDTSTDVLVVGTDAVVEAMEAGQLPLYIRKLQELDIPDEEKEPLLSLYTGGVIRSFDYYVNNTIEIQGAALLFHGPYKGKDSFNHPGYYFTAFLTTQEDEKGNAIILRSSSASLMLHVAYMLNQRGWFLWKEPVKYRVTKGDDGSHRLLNMDKPKSLKTRKGKEV